MPKQKKSKLDQFAATLADMEAQKKTLDEMLTWLRDEGVTCSPSTLSDFLSAQRSRRLRDKLLSQIASGAQQCREVEKQFGKNPAPELETLVKLHQVLIMELSTQGNVEPELLKMADSMLRTVMESISGQTKAAFKERELTIQEQKFAESKKDEQTKALEYCLEEAKAFTHVRMAFEKAFALLKQAKTPLAPLPADVP